MFVVNLYVRNFDVLTSFPLQIRRVDSVQIDIPVFCRAFAVRVVLTFVAPEEMAHEI
jgi:hypothetical protein